MASNLATVVAFEVKRTLRTKVFWIAALVVPVLFAAIMFISARATADAVSTSAQPASFSWEYVDDSGLVSDSVARAAGGVKITDAAQGMDDVLTGKVEAFIHYPADPTAQATQVAGQDVGVIDSGRYTSMAIGVLQASASASVGDPRLVTLATGDIQVDQTTYANGQRSGGVGEVIPPLIFLAVLYLVMIMQGNRMLESSLEEKENRVTEMILTTIKPSSLLAGKVVSLIIVGVIQMMVTILPVLVAYLIVRGHSAVGGLLSSLEFEPTRMIIGALLLIAAFLLFTAGCVAIGAAVPTVKDASAMFTVVMLVLLLPLFVVQVVISNPNATVVQVFTYFPLTAPVTGLIRNALGSLTWWQGLIEAAIALLCAWAVFWLAVRIYQYGSIEYDKKIDLRSVLARR
ncbi:MAG: ABC transporter permease [Propionibacteriaceae bacterium]|nr:ABC transporter permease [Propionibacteriaceae bacterium]